MNISEIDAFFQEHPLKERYFSVDVSERAGVAAVAQRDVLAAVAGCTVSGEEAVEFLHAAIAEQTIFLMLNPEYLTGCYTAVSTLSSGGVSRKFSGTASPLGQRAAALIAPLLAAAEKTQNSTSSGSGDNSGDNGEKETFSGVLTLTRG